MATTEPRASTFECLQKAAILVGKAREMVAVHSPFTGAVLSRIPAATEEDVEFAIARARAAQPGWSALACADRARIFLRFHDLLLKRQAEALDLIQLETGKARRHAFEEILDTAIV